MRRRALVVLTVLAGLALGAPATAPAADADVVAAWQSEDRALTSATASLSRGMRAAERSRFRRTGGVMRSLRTLARLTTAVRGRVLQQSPSTSAGREARTLVLRSLRGHLKSLASLRKATRAAMGRRSRAAHRFLARARRQGRIAADDAQAARNMFEYARRRSAPQAPPGEQPPPDGGPPPSEQPPPGQSPPVGDPIQPPPPPPDGGDPPPDDPACPLGVLCR